MVKKEHKRYQKIYIDYSALNGEKKSAKGKSKVDGNGGFMHIK